MTKSLRPRPIHRKLLGLAVRQRREKRGVSQEKLAEEANVHRNYVGLVERGDQNLTVEMLIRFAKALGCRASELLAEAEQ